MKVKVSEFIKSNKLDKYLSAGFISHLRCSENEERLVEDLEKSFEKFSGLSSKNYLERQKKESNRPLSEEKSQADKKPEKIEKSGESSGTNDPESIKASGNESGKDSASGDNKSDDLPDDFVKNLDLGKNKNKR